MNKTGNKDRKQTAHFNLHLERKQTNKKEVKHTFTPRVWEKFASQTNG